MHKGNLNYFVYSNWTEKHVTVMRSASPDFDSSENKSESDSESDSESEKIQNIDNDNISGKLVSGISCAFDDDDKDDFTPPYVYISCISDESRDVDENVETSSNQGMIKDDSEYSKGRKRTSNTELCSSAKTSKSSSPVDCQIDLLLRGDVEDSNSEFPEQDAGLVPDEDSKKVLVVTKSTVSPTEFAEKQDENIYSQSLFSQDAFNQTQGKLSSISQLDKISDQQFC